MLLREGLEQLVFNELLAHADAGVRDCELEDSGVAVAGQLSGIGVDLAAWFVVLDRVRSEVEHDLLDMQRRAHKLGVSDTSRMELKHDVASVQLALEQALDIVNKLNQVKTLPGDLGLPCLQLAHVEHVVNQVEQVVGR